MPLHPSLPETNWDMKDFNIVTVQENTSELSIVAFWMAAKYADYFIDKGVSGAILVECTVDTLEKDLHVTSSLHRIKLMLLIMQWQTICIKPPSLSAIIKS